MKKWLRRIRGAVGTGVTWAAACFGVGVILGLLILGFSADPVQLVIFGVGFAWMGFIGRITVSVFVEEWRGLHTRSGGSG